jgi:hypothetical protein
MKSRMTAILLILLGLLVWTGSTAWARDHRGKRQGEGFKTHQNYGKNRYHRPEKWDRQANRYHRSHEHHHYRRPGPPAKHRHWKHHRAQKWHRYSHPGRFKRHHKAYKPYRHRHPAKHHFRNHRPYRHHGGYKGHGHDVFRLGVSVWQPGMSFGFMVSDRD